MPEASGREGIGDVYIRATFRALVDAILPMTVRYDEAEFTLLSGAVQLQVDLYVITEIDHSQFVPADEREKRFLLSRTTAQLLDAAAEQLIRQGWAIQPIVPAVEFGGGPFASLSREDRLRALELLDRLALPLHSLPEPYRNDPGLIQTMVNTFNQLTMFGYYSEWFGYGTSRLAPPDDQRLEIFPPGWRLCGYPGPSFGYRDFRGFLLYYFHDKGDCSDD